MRRARTRGRRPPPRAIVLRIVYWLAVLLVSLAVLVALILLLESRDSSQVGHGANLLGPHAKR